METERAWFAELALVLTLFSFEYAPPLKSAPVVRDGAITEAGRRALVDLALCKITTKPCS